MTTPGILLTGTSGLARQVLVGLLRRTPERVAMLIPDRVIRPAGSRAAAMFDRLALERAERERVEIVTGDVGQTGLGLREEIRERLTDSLDTIVHTAGGTANALLLAERCFMAGRLQRFIHVNGDADDRMVRAAMNAGLPVTIVGPSCNTMDLVVTAVVRALDARCA
jgi:hypothetical protein